MSRRRAKTFEVDLVADRIKAACDCVGETLGHCIEQQDHDTIELLLPALGQLWSLRWELNLHANPALKGAS